MKCSNCQGNSYVVHRIDKVEGRGVFWCPPCIERLKPNFFAQRAKEQAEMIAAREKRNPLGFNDARMVDVNRRAAAMLRDYKARGIHQFKEEAIKDCEDRVKKAYTTWYRDFWKEVLRVIQRQKV